MARHLANSGKRGSVRSPMLRSSRRTRLMRGHPLLEGDRVTAQSANRTVSAPD
jgi:hypothetical protein